MLGKIPIAMRDDGHFGTADPLNWPQLHCTDRPYLALIPKRPRAGSWFEALWERPAISEFQRANDLAEGQAFGYLSSARIALARKLVDWLRARAERFKKVSRAVNAIVVEELGRLIAGMENSVTLFGVPSTYRNVVRQWARLHWCWAECWAFLLWHEHVRSKAETTVVGDPGDICLQDGLDGSGVMGVVTPDQVVAQKWLAAGVPVWFLQLRHATGELQIANREPIPLIEADEVETGQSVVQGDVLGRAMAGTEHMRAISAASEAVLDIEHDPLPADYGLEFDAPASAPSHSRSKAPSKGEQTVAIRVVAWSHEISKTHRLRVRPTDLSNWFTTSCLPDAQYGKMVSVV